MARNAVVPLNHPRIRVSEISRDDGWRGVAHDWVQCVNVTRAMEINWRRYVGAFTRLSHWTRLLRFAPRGAVRFP